MSETRIRQNPLSKVDDLLERLQRIDEDLTVGPWSVVENHATKDEERTYTIRGKRNCMVCRSGRVVDWSTMQSEMWGIVDRSDALGIVELRAALPEAQKVITRLRDILHIVADDYADIMNSEFAMPNKPRTTRQDVLANATRKLKRGNL